MGCRCFQGDLLKFWNTLDFKSPIGHFKAKNIKYRLWLSIANDRYISSALIKYNSSIHKIMKENKLIVNHPRRLGQKMERTDTALFVLTAPVTHRTRLPQTLQHSKLKQKPILSKYLLKWRHPVHVCDGKWVIWVVHRRAPLTITEVAWTPVRGMGLACPALRGTSGPYKLETSYIYEIVTRIKILKHCQ